MASVQERSDLHPVARESRLRPRQGSPAVPTLGLGHGTTGTPTSERGATLVAHVYFVNMTRESIRGCPRESAGGSVHHELDPCHGRARHPNQPVKLWLHTASCAVCNQHLSRDPTSPGGDARGRVREKRASDRFVTDLYTCHVYLAFRGPGPSPQTRWEGGGGVP